MPQEIQHVSDTAVMVAQFRAVETARPDALFRDPFAAALAGDHGKKILTTVPRSSAGAWSVVIRTVVIDEYILQAIDEGVDLILNLGAGLDTRPYRMALPPSLRWVEVDYPHVISLKQQRLAAEQPRCRLEHVSFDLTNHAARQEFLAGMNAAARKILVITEGVALYLPEADVAALADDLRRAGKIEYWIIDYYSPEALRASEKVRARFMRNTPFRFAPKDWFGFFIAHGWQARETRYLVTEADRLGRPIPVSFWRMVWWKFASVFIPRARRERMKRFAAYVLLVPCDGAN